ncbi:MAG: S8 family peptidase [Bacillus sp. (in: firmicutes)]
MRKIIAMLTACCLTVSSGAAGAYAVGKGGSFDGSQTKHSILQTNQQKGSKKHTDYYQADTLIVKHTGSISPAILKNYKGKVIKQVKELGYSVVKFQNDMYAKQATKKLSEAKNVTSVMPSVKYTENTIKNDPKVADQYFNKMLNLPAAQKKAGKNKVLVAVIDTGIDRNHPELKNKIHSSYNVHNPVNAPLPDDHGTHVSGIIAAEKGNAIGGYGINPNASILSIDVFNREWGAFDYNIAEGILYAVKKKAKVINLSLGGPIASPVIEAAIKKARDAGIIIVAAAGNGGSDSPGYPAAYEGVISVGAVDKSKKLTPWSSYGVTTDLVAPGNEIYAPIYDYEKKSSFAKYSGTSMASPVVAGTASLLLSKYPNLKPEQIEYILKRTATDLGTKGFDNKYGYGMVNPLAAMNFDMKKIPSLTVNNWNKDTILKNAKSFSGNSYSTKRTFTKPLDQHWIKRTVKKGETYQIDLKSSNMFDSKLLVNVYASKTTQKKEMTINDVKEGRTEGHFFTAPYDGTLTIGVKDISGNYDVQGSKLSEYNLAVKKVTVKPDESSEEKPVMIDKLPYTTKGMHLVGSNGDDDFFQFTTGDASDMVKLEVAGQPGADLSMMVYEQMHPEEDAPEDESEMKSHSEEAEDVEEGEPWFELVQEINSAGVAEGEMDILETSPNTTYMIQLSNKYEGGSGDFFEFFAMSEGYTTASSFIEGTPGQHADPYTMKVSKVSMPKDEDGIDSYESLWPEDGEYVDGDIIETLTELSAPHKLYSQQKGYLQTRYDMDWYRFKADRTGVYAFNLGKAKHVFTLHKVETITDEEDYTYRALSVIGENGDWFTGSMSNTMYVSLEKGQSYFMSVESDWYTGKYSTDPYTFKASFVSAPADKYENNDSYTNVKTLPATKFHGDYSKTNDEDVYHYKPKTSGNYSLSVTNKKPSTKGLPAKVKEDVYSYIAILEDKNQNKTIDSQDFETVKILDSYYDPSGVYGSHYFDKKKSYFIVIFGETETMPFSLAQYTFELKQFNQADEDAKSIVKNNIPSKPIKMIELTKGKKWERTGKINAFNTKKSDEDWFELKLTKTVTGQLTLSGGKELDGAFDIYKNGKRIAGSDRYGKNDTEVLNIKLSKGTYHIKVRDAQGTASLSPYKLTFK